MTGEALYLREGFQKSFLRGFFSLTSIAKESMRDMKDPRAESSKDFRERRLIVFAREAGQFNFRSVFVPVRQKPLLWSAPAERSGDGALDDLLIIATLPFAPN